MTISSMTGFASQKGGALIHNQQFDWVWEIKSVNGKSLDLKSRLPFGYEALTAELKDIAMRFLNRGNVQVVLDLKNQSEAVLPKINDELLAVLTSKAVALYKSNPEVMGKPSPVALLGMKGVLETDDSGLSDEENDVLSQKLIADFVVVCEKLAKDRQTEGEKIKVALGIILRQIAELVGQVANIAETIPAKMKEKLAEQVKLWADGVEVSEDRLAQELVFYVTRADIREEVDRLQAHVKTAEGLLNADGAVGRRLDFLCQELNREANTTCSKSCDIALTNLGMELKALIEQFREQVQNIE